MIVWRLIETTGAPAFKPVRWQADCGRVQFAIGVVGADVFQTGGDAYWCGILGSGADYVEADTLCVRPTLEEAKIVCETLLAAVIEELNRAKLAMVEQRTAADAKKAAT